MATVWLLVQQEALWCQHKANYYPDLSLTLALTLTLTEYEQNCQISRHFVNMGTAVHTNYMLHIPWSLAV